jgi:hypothetical protein
VNDAQTILGDTSLAEGTQMMTRRHVELNLCTITCVHSYVEIRTFCPSMVGVDRTQGIHVKANGNLVSYFAIFDPMTAISSPVYGQIVPLQINLHGPTNTPRSSVAAAQVYTPGTQIQH